MDLIGKQIGNYEILDVIGRGGMASVYRARQLSLNRHVALKVLEGPQAFDTKFRRRFEHEARAVAQLSHPNIVPVYDFGENEEFGVLFIVMELVTGGCLSSMKGMILLAGEIVPTIVQIARALDYAHQRGIVHRDVKPGNILISDDGRPMLTDFGLVRMEAVSLHTETGITVGTPTYMSPEQAMGQELDGRSDEYSLAMVLYELVAGRPAYQGGAAVEVMHQVVYDPLPSPRQFNSTISRELETVLMRALSKEREARFLTAGEFANALAKSVKHERTPTSKLLTVATRANQRSGNPASLPTQAPVAAKAGSSGAQADERPARSGLWGATRNFLLWLVVLALLLVAGALVAANWGASIANQTIAGYLWNWNELGGDQPKSWDEAALQLQIEPWLKANGLESLSNRKVRIMPNNIVELSTDTPYAPVYVQLRLFVIGDALQVRWEQVNGVTPFVVGDIFTSGVNQGLQRSYENAPLRLERVETKPGQLLMYFGKK